MENDTTIHVKISVTSWFKKYTAGREELELEVKDGASALYAAVNAGIPEAEIGFITVNAVKADKEQAVKSGDRIKVFPYIIGG
jgi:molybdopterin converting factor small subunit